jgi:hypothetical protein
MKPRAEHEPEIPELSTMVFRGSSLGRESFSPPLLAVLVTMCAYEIQPKAGDVIGNIGRIFVKRQKYVKQKLQRQPYLFWRGDVDSSY